MHVTKDKDGNFSVNEEPLRLSDTATERLLCEMDKRDQQVARERFLDECDKAYRARHEKVPADK
jgi:hypothetical protein